MKQATETNLLRATACILSLAILLYICLFGYEVVCQRRAQRISEALNHLVIGSTDWRESQRVMASVHGEEQPDCSESECIWSVAVDNFRVAALFGNTGVKMSWVVTSRNGVVDDKRLHYQIGVGFMVPSVDVDEHSTKAREIFPGVRTRRRYGERWRVDIDVIQTPNTPHNWPVELNYGCFRSLFGCDVQDLAPKVVWDKDVVMPTSIEKQKRTP